MSELLELYLNGQFSELKVVMRNEGISFSEFFDYYIDNCSRDGYSLKLLVSRLTD